MATSDVQWLLDHGADPDWVPPNGISVLEHTIYRYWNGEAVDLIAHRVTPRKALWIAAGIGDAAAVRSYFDGNGRLTDAARENRPDFTAMGGLPAPMTFGDSDADIIWEAFLLAGWNDRLAVLGELLDRGCPIDHAPWGQPLLHFAISEKRVALVEFLIKRGANLDYRGFRPDANAREVAEQFVVYRPVDAAQLRILELCGGRPAEIVLREHEERRDQRIMQTSPQIEKAFVFAKQDAIRAGLPAVSPENLFVGLARVDELAATLLSVGGVCLPDLRAALGVRFEEAPEPPAEMTADADCSAILMSAREEAVQRKNSHLTPLHVLKVLLQRAPQSVRDLIQSTGGSIEETLVETDRTLGGMG